MKTFRFFVFFFFAQFFLLPASANTHSAEFSTPRDLTQNAALSNILLKNNGSSTTTAYGLYVRQLAQVAAGGSCDSATTLYSASDNKTAGAFVMPVLIAPGRLAAVGSNYLYNLLYGALYYYPAAHPPGSTCTLPGCTWGSDNTIYDWCIYLGALAPVVTSTGYTSNVPPAAELASSGSSYNYNLISNSDYVTLGPITCDDQTQTCTVASSQTQSFS